MLIRFSVKNFLSFASREDNMSEEFSMIAGRVRGKRNTCMMMERSNC